MFGRRNHRPLVFTTTPFKFMVVTSKNTTDALATEELQVQHPLAFLYQNHHAGKRHREREGGKGRKREEGEREGGKFTKRHSNTTHTHKFRVKVSPSTSCCLLISTAI